MKMLMSMGVAAVVAGVAWGQQNAEGQGAAHTGEARSAAQAEDWEPLDPGAEAEGTAGLRTESEISKFQKATTFLGMEVRGSEGRRLGRVQDLVFDLRGGRLGYVVLETEKSGIQRMVPVPLTAVKPAEDGEHLVLNMSEPLLAAAVGVEENDLPPLDVFEPSGGEEAVGAPGSVETGRISSGGAIPQRSPRRERVTRAGSGEAPPKKPSTEGKSLPQGDN